MPRNANNTQRTPQQLAQIVHNHRLLLEELRGRVYGSLPVEERARIDRDFLRNPISAYVRLFAHRQIGAAGASNRSQMRSALARGRRYFADFGRETGYDAATGQRVRRVSPAQGNQPPPPPPNTPPNPPPTPPPAPPPAPPPTSTSGSAVQSPRSSLRWMYSSSDIAAEHARYNPVLDERRAMIRRQIALGGTREDAIRRYDRILRIRQLRELRENNMYLKVLGKQFRGFLGILAPMAIAKTGYDVLQGEYRSAKERVGFETFKDIFQVKAPKGEKDFEDFAARIIASGGKYEDAMDIWSKEVTWASGLKYKFGQDRLRIFGQILGKEPSLDVMNNPSKQIPWLLENLRGISEEKKTAITLAGVNPYLIKASNDNGNLSEDQIITAVMGGSERKRKMRGPIRGFGYTLSGAIPSVDADLLARYQSMTPEERKRVRSAKPKAYSPMYGPAPLDTDLQIKNALERFPEVASEIERRTSANIEVNLNIENNFPEGDYDPEDVKNSVQDALEAGSQKIVDGMYGAFTNLGVTEGY